MPVNSKAQQNKGDDSPADQIANKKKGALRENTEAIIIAIILALFIRTFVVQAFKIPSGSMKETLQVGDHILVNKFIYGVKVPFIDKKIISVSNPKRGDIVVFKFPEDPGKDFIKRVIAVAGDVVEIRDKKVYVNQQPVDSGYAEFKDTNIIPGKLAPRDNYGPVTVPENSLFVMGDNRDESYDSRFWGFVKLDSLKGKAFMIYWSWDREKFSWKKPRLGVRWNRLGDILH